jgi:hypothetical protein
MQTYDFVWQPTVGGLPFDALKFEAALERVGATHRPDGPWVWKLSAGETVITALNDAGAVVGFDLRVPVSDSTALVTEALTRGSALAAESTLQLVDPQLSRVVTERDREAVEASYIRVARYAGSYTEGDAPAWSAEAAQDLGLAAPTKAMLAVLVFVATMYFAYQMVAG